MKKEKIEKELREAEILYHRAEGAIIVLRKLLEGKNGSNNKPKSKKTNPS